DVMWWGRVLVATGAATWLVIGSCTPAGRPGAPAPAPTAVGPTQVHGEPEIRVGLAVGASTATVGGAGGLIVTDPSGSYLARVGQGEIWRVAITGTGIAVVSPAGGNSTPSPQLDIIASDSSAPVVVNGRRYRGTLTVLRDRTGITL